MLRLGTFRVDGTPPVGCGVDFGLTEKTIGVRDPLQLRGFLLRGEREAALVVAADWCGIMGSAREELRAALAAGCGIGVERVVIHCVHQHDAPFLAFEIEPLLGVETFPRSWWKALLSSCEEAARKAAREADTAEVAEVGHAETRLAGYASNRRILAADGKLRGMRWSRCQDPELVAAPVGTIDPMLRTVALRARSGRLLASWSFYATHPQVSNGRRIYSADAPGEAMRIVRERRGGGEHALLTGAGGNVTAGKYSSTTDLEGNLLRFGSLLGDGVTRNLGSMRWEAAGEPAWRTGSFPFPAASGKRDALRAELQDPSTAASRRRIVAPLLAAMEWPECASYPLALLSLGAARMLFLPGELFVEHQLAVQAFSPGRFLALAANCGDDFLYLPTAAAFAQCGYEVESFCWCTPEFESRLAEAVRGLLAA